LARKRALKNNLLKAHNLIQIEEMPKMWDLLRKSKYYLINAHPLGHFSFPNIPKRIVNIGGIEVEMEGILNKIEEEKKLQEKEKNKGKITMIEDPVYNWIKKVLIRVKTRTGFSGYSSPESGYFYKTGFSGSPDL